MALFTVLAAGGIKIWTQAAGPYNAPQGAVVNLTPPPSLGFGTDPSAYPGYGPPSWPGEANFVPMSFAGQRTAAAIAAKQIIAAPAGAVETPGIMPPKMINGQPGMHVAVQN